MPRNVERFLEFIHKVERIRRRNGASDWRVFRDLGEEGRFVERFIIRSWAEYVRLRTRMTMADRETAGPGGRSAAAGSAGARVAADRDLGTSEQSPLRRDGRAPEGSASIPLVFPLRHLDAQLVQVVVERIAGGHHAQRPAVLDDGEVPEAALVHEAERLDEGLVRMHRLRLRGHDVGERGGRRVAPGGDHAKERIALGEDPGKPRAVDDEQRPLLFSFIRIAASSTVAVFSAMAGGCPVMMERSDRSDMSGSRRDLSKGHIGRHAPRRVSSGGDTVSAAALGPSGPIRCGAPSPLARPQERRGAVFVLPFDPARDDLQRDGWVVR